MAWELDDQSKQYRLMLISQEEEIIHIISPETAGKHRKKFQETVLLRKPLIEMDLYTRLQYAHMLSIFLEALNDHLYALYFGSVPK